MERRSAVIRTAFPALAVWIVADLLAAADWPTFGGDSRRSGVTVEKLALPLSEVWVYRTHAPRPAWPAPARQDFWHEKSQLTPSITFDRAMHLAVAQGGVFFGSSADDKITCLDAASGRVRWSFFTEGPVRLAPSVVGGKVYAGSDDGHVYCLAAGDGKLLWQYRPGPQDRRIPGNGRMISLWPVRSGVLVDGGSAYLCAGLFPSYGVYLCALDADDGSERWKRKLDGVSPQGHMLASETRLYVPSGRTSPAIFDRRDGQPLGTLHDNQRGGSYALSADEIFIYRGEQEGSLGISDSRTRERLVLFRGLHLAVRREMAFLHSEGELAAFNRMEYLGLARQRNKVTARRGDLEKRLKELRKRPDLGQSEKLAEEMAEVRQQLAELNRAMDACWAWKRPCAYPHSLILAGDVLFIGGDDAVAAFGTTDGEILWKGKVTGEAHGLAAASGRLFVSTSKGVIHCFQ